MNSKQRRKYISRDLNDYKDIRSENRPDSVSLSLANRRTVELFGLPVKAKIIHLNELFKQDLDIWSESPGLPWRDEGFKTKGDIKNNPDAVNRVRRFTHFIKDGDKIPFPDCLAHVQSHRCECGECQVRVVWRYPATVTFMEAMFALSLIRAYQEIPDEIRPIAYSYETATNGMCKLRKRFGSSKANFTNLVFKKFAKTVPPWLTDFAFDILMLNVDFVHYENYGVTDARKMIVLYNSLRHYFIHTNIRTADGKSFKKDNGIPSGSYFTQLIGSIVNCILVNWMSLEQFGDFPLDCIFLGDDSFISSSKKWNLKWCNMFVSKIGMEINVEKSSQSEIISNMKFLGCRVDNGKAVNGCCAMHDSSSFSNTR